MTRETQGGRQSVPPGPFEVVAGRAVVEFEGDDSLVFVGPGTVCEFTSRAWWTPAEPMRIRPLGAGEQAGAVRADRQ